MDEKVHLEGSFDQDEDFAGAKYKDAGDGEAAHYPQPPRGKEGVEENCEEKCEEVSSGQKRHFRWPTNK